MKQDDIPWDPKLYKVFMESFRETAVPESAKKLYSELKKENSEPTELHLEKLEKLLKLIFNSPTPKQRKKDSF